MGKREAVERETQKVSSYHAKAPYEEHPRPRASRPRPPGRDPATPLYDAAVLFVRRKLRSSFRVLAGIGAAVAAISGTYLHIGVAVIADDKGGTFWGIVAFCTPGVSLLWFIWNWVAEGLERPSVGYSFVAFFISWLVAAVFYGISEWLDMKIPVAVSAAPAAMNPLP
jgi:hypothetical protein